MRLSNPKNGHAFVTTYAYGRLTPEASLLYVENIQVRPALEMPDNARNNKGWRPNGSFLE
jgi:hypothetical protein